MIVFIWEHLQAPFLYKGQALGWGVLWTEGIQKFIRLWSLLGRICTTKLQRESKAGHRENCQNTHSESIRCHRAGPWQVKCFLRGGNAVGIREALVQGTHLSWYWSGCSEGEQSRGWFLLGFSASRHSLFCLWHPQHFLYLLFLVVSARLWSSLCGCLFTPPWGRSGYSLLQVAFWASISWESQGTEVPASISLKCSQIRQWCDFSCIQFQRETAPFGSI